MTIKLQRSPIISSVRLIGQPERRVFLIQVPPVQNNRAGIGWPVQNSDIDRIKAPYDRKELPLPEPGSMCYMMSKQQYFGRKYGNADPHLMFWFPKTNDMFWARVFLAPRCTYINTL